MKKSQLAEIMDKIFPNFTCMVCKGEINTSRRALVCDACFEKFPIGENVCDVCGCEVSKGVSVCERCADNDEPWNFSRARSGFTYAEPIKNLILRLKYSAEGDVAKFAASQLFQTFSENKMHADVLIPVPLSRRRAKVRGYNQATLVAQELAKIIKTQTGAQVAVAENTLVRVKQTEAQKKMNVKQRQENLRGAFEIRSPFDEITEKRVVIIDDVFTTGTTANECARVLRAANPKSVEVLTIAGVTQKTAP